MTERARYSFVVKESPGGEPWIVLELLAGPGLKVFEHGFLGFDLEKGTSLADAKKFAQRLNAMVPSVSFTDLREP